MVLLLKLNKDVTIHDLQKLNKELKETCNIDSELSGTYEYMKLIVNKSISIQKIQETVCTCGGLYIDTNMMDSMMRTLFNTSPFITGFDMSKIDIKKDKF